MELTGRIATSLGKADLLSDDTKIHDAMEVEIFELKSSGRQLEEKLAFVYGTNNRAHWVGAGAIVVRGFLRISNSGIIVWLR